MSPHTRKTVVPKKAPKPPENIPLKHYAWAPMWVENGNTVITFVGDPGKGKSWASLRAGEVVDPNFSIENVAWDIVEFLRLVIDDSFGQGSIIILEEGSVEAGAYSWHSKSNEVLRKVLDTWRHQNRGAFFNLPSFSSFEKGARRRTNAIVEMTEAKPWKDYSQGKFKLVNYNNIDDNFTTPFPTLEGKVRKYIRFNPPSDDLIEAYETEKANYTSELNVELLEELLEDMAPEDSGPEPADIAEEILEEDKLEEYISEYNGRRFVKPELIEVDYGVGGRRSKKVKTILEREAEL